MRVMYRKDLDSVFDKGCGNPECNCKASYVHPKCHIGAGCNVRYEEGILYISCRECDRPIAPIKVAEHLTIV